MRKAAGLGEVETGLARGRSTWSPAGQVAELAVREATGLRDADALTVDPGVVPGAVRVRGPGGRSWWVEVAEREGATRPASCGAAALPAVSLVATAVGPAGADRAD